MDRDGLSVSRGKTLGTDKSKFTKPRLRGKKLPSVGTMSMIKGPGHVSSFKPLLQPVKKPVKKKD
jgi:hypothetical protein